MAVIASIAAIFFVASVMALLWLRSRPRLRALSWLVLIFAFIPSASVLFYLVVSVVVAVTFYSLFGGWEH